MFEIERAELENGRIQHIKILENKTILTYGDVVQRWQDDQRFVEMFIQILANCAFTAFRWETPPITSATQSQEFQFVLLQDDWLGRRQPNTQAFANQLARREQQQTVATFPNLGGDAVMVVPAGLIEDSAYSEIASFSRHAPLKQQIDLWRAVGQAMSKHLGAEPVWLSCAGGGVAWLHVRLDSRPKYYGYAPFRHFENNGLMES